MTTCSGCPAVWGGDRPCHCGTCHETFSGLELYDQHRDHNGDHGRCRNPADVVDASGTRRMWLRDGMWRGPKMTALVRARVKGATRS